MLVIGLRLLTVLALAFLFGLLVSWVFSWFDNPDRGGGDTPEDDPIPPTPPGLEKKMVSATGKKRLVEVDESYYLEEFDLDRKTIE